MEMTILVLTLAYAAVAALPFVLPRLLRRQRRMYLFAPDAFLSIVLALYTLPVALDAIVWQQWMGYDEGLRAEHVAAGIALTLSFHAALLFGYYAASTVWRVRRPMSERLAALQEHLPPRAVLMTIAAGGLGLYAAYIFIAFGGIGAFVGATRFERFRAASGLGVFTIGLYVANVGIVGLFLRALLRRRAMGDGSSRRPLLRWGLFALGYLVFFMLLGDRRQPFFLAVALAAAYMLVRPPERRRRTFARTATRLATGVGVAASYAALQIFARVRGLSAPLPVWLDFVRTNFRMDWLNPSTGEFGAAPMVLGLLYRDTSDFRMGGTYLDALLIQVPSALVPDRPEALTVSFAREYFPWLHAQGGSMAYSFVGEAFVNFGVLGPAIIGLFLGLFLRWLYIRTACSTRAYYVLGYVCLVPFLFILPRADTASLLKAGLFAVAFPVFGLWLASKLRPRRLLVRAVRGRYVQSTA